MRPATALLFAPLLLLAACSGGGEDSIASSASSPSPTPPLTAAQALQVATQVQGMAPADYYQATCAACHGVEKEGGLGPSLAADLLTQPAEVYFDTIKLGRPGTAMPTWGAVGLTDPEVRLLVAYLRGEEIEAPSTVAASGSNARSLALGVEATGLIELPPIARTASQPLDWAVTNTSNAVVELVKLSSSTLSLFLLDALPIRLEPGESRALRLVFVPNPRASAGDPAIGSAALLVRNGDAVEQPLRLNVRSEVGPVGDSLRLSTMQLPDYPARVATWDNHVYVGYLGGLIEVYQWSSADQLELVESVTSIAETPNHGPDGQPNPDAQGRLIGGFAIDSDGALYVTHSDPRLNEGDFLRTGHLADLNSGSVTALDGPPGEYGDPDHRRDLITGLPRNVTNHIPLGLAIRDNWLYIAVGAMTDSGQPDESKPEPDTDISGTVLRLNLEAHEQFPLALTEPGTHFATAEVLQPNLLEIYATGIRNAFGLAFGPDRQLYLSDQSSDGGATPQPAGDDGPPGLDQNLGPDHLHLVQQHDFLGQPNLARGESILNDGSEYATPISNPNYSPPIHVFGTHNSATGIAWYQGEAFPDLQNWLLVSKFSGAAGLQALRVEDGRVAEVRVLATRPLLSNVTDVAIGPDGQIVIAEFWEKRLRIANSYAPPAPSVPSEHLYFGINLDNDNDSPTAYSERAGLEAEVLVRFFRFPLGTQDQSALVDFLNQAAQLQVVALVTLEPHDGLEAVTDDAIDELATIVAAANAAGAPVMIRFAHEMNGSWYPWSQQPTPYIETFRRVADAIHTAAPATPMLWAPNYGGGYPFQGGPYETTLGEPGFELLDTNADGLLDITDDPYAPYYPGDDAVDWVGMSLYHWGSAYPWGENEVPEAGKFTAQLRGTYVGANGDDTPVPDFYGEYAESRDKPLAIPETAALYDPAQSGDEFTIKSTWWNQVFAPEVSADFPLLRMINWFEHRKIENEVGGVIIDWRATGDPVLAQPFANRVRNWIQGPTRD